jgi:hypothetical protein
VVDVLEAMKVTQRRPMSSLKDQNREFYFEDLNKLEHRLAKCIGVEGDYIEK